MALLEGFEPPNLPVRSRVSYPVERQELAHSAAPKLERLASCSGAPSRDSRIDDEHVAIYTRSLEWRQLEKVATRSGFEPLISPVTGERLHQSRPTGRGRQTSSAASPARVNWGRMGESNPRSRSENPASDH